MWQPEATVRHAATQEPGAHVDNGCWLKLVGFQACVANATSAPLIHNPFDAAVTEAVPAWSDGVAAATDADGAFLLCRKGHALHQRLQQHALVHAVHRVQADGDGLAKQAQRR